MSDEKTSPNAGLRHPAEQEKTSLTAALRHLSEQERRTSSEHATPGELTAYHEGTLPPPVEARIREHLAHCKLCSDLLLDLAGFADLAPPPGVPELTDAEVEADWQKLRRKMEIGQGETKKEELAPVVPFQPAARHEPELPRRPPPWFAIAASLLAVAGVSFGLYERTELKRAQQVGLVDNVISLAIERGQREEAMSSRQGGAVTFDLEDSFDGYEADIMAGTSKIISLKGKQPFIYVPGGALKPGEYQIRLFGILKNERSQLGEFPLRVDAP